ncbi:hypothetical protein QWY93_19515 [Echinicola jeungdonensis]|nr:hypothetical protein [Echinicola jeungdonensis]MDN3667768.1 hypothetical protein [Echinicola jeungdonensis]MDN3671442.1 hypothetical protein [Echinicola jeungdonensis]
MSLHAEELIAGNAYTIWFVIFNAPENCATSPCGEPDIFNPETMTDVSFGGGNIAGNSSITISGHKKVGDLSGSAMPFFNDLLGLDIPIFGLIDPWGAEVHLVLRSHGPKVPANMPDLINSFDGGCTTFLDAGQVTDDPGECADSHFAIFQP